MACIRATGTRTHFERQSLLRAVEVCAGCGNTRPCCYKRGLEWANWHSHRCFGALNSVSPISEAANTYRYPQQARLCSHMVKIYHTSTTSPDLKAAATVRRSGRGTVRALHWCLQAHSDSNCQVYCRGVKGDNACRQPQSKGKMADGRCVCREGMFTQVV